jgi:hypothetical protein
MKCHLGGCLSFRCDFTLEPFARGLASEDADEIAQPIVVATLGDASLCSVSSLAPIALPSRPNHSAAAPCVKLILCIRAEHIVVAVT